MLQDTYIPKYDIRKSASILISKSAAAVFPLVSKLDFSDSLIVSFLFRLRGLPVPGSLTREGLKKIHFVELAEVKNEEIILGLIGNFWTPSGALQDFKPGDFHSLKYKNYLKATWSFELIPLSENKTLLVTETRVVCPTKAASLKFKIYWFFVQPFSQVIRYEILKCIKKQTEIQALHAKTYKV